MYVKIMGERERTLNEVSSVYPILDGVSTGRPSAMPIGSAHGCSSPDAKIA